MGVNEKRHELKIWPEYFSAVQDGSKTFEIRNNDRGFAIGDTLVLKEWDPEKGELTGRELERKVSFLLPGGNFGVEVGYCVMALTK